MKASLTTAIAGSVWLLFAAAGDAATFSALNSTTVKFNAGTSEANLIDLGAAKVSFGNTTVYIGTNQVSSNNQDPIVTSLRMAFATGSAVMTARGLMVAALGCFGMRRLAIFTACSPLTAAQMGLIVLGVRLRAGWVAMVAVAALKPACCSS